MRDLQSSHPGFRCSSSERRIPLRKWEEPLRPSLRCPVIRQMFIELLVQGRQNTAGQGEPWALIAWNLLAGGDRQRTSQPINEQDSLRLQDVLRRKETV